MSDWRQTAKKLFGRAARLEVAAYLLEHESTYLTEITHALGLPASVVAQELANLEQVGLLRKHTRLASERRIYYTVLPSPWWDVFEAAAAVIAAQPNEGSTAGTAGGAAAW